MNITKHEGQSALPRCDCRLVFRIRTFETQQAKIGPTCWKTDICDLTQCDHCNWPLGVQQPPPLNNSD